MNRKRPAVMVLIIVPVLVIVAALVLGFTRSSSADPEYETRASVLLLVPSGTTTNTTVASRELVANGDSAAVTGNVLVDVMNSAPISQRLADKGLRGSYEVASTEGAILSVRTTADTAGDSSDDMDLVLDELSAELQSIQRSADIPPENQIADQVFDRVGPVER